MAGLSPNDAAPLPYNAGSSAAASSRDTTPLLEAQTTHRHKQPARWGGNPMLTLFLGMLIPILVVSFTATAFYHYLEIKLETLNKAIQKYEMQEVEMLDRLSIIRESIVNGTRTVEQQQRRNDELRHEWEGWQREKLERESMRLYWADVAAADKCLGYNNMEYSARLANLLPTVDGIVACKRTPIMIHSRSYESPDFCEDRGENGIYGHWTVTGPGEYKCNTYWEAGYKDKGCTAPGSGSRRFEKRLGGIHSGQDWEVLCNTTPTTIMHQYFERPRLCLNWGKNGVWAVWDVRDVLCD